ncbi:MAG: dihydrolipoyl dehydrogenase [Actinomycetota bacterium]|nr:dihydrolipoyl dehydrogenase [Actinomycetota bacterium]
MIVEVPDIGDFTDVPIVELLVAVGDTVAAEDPLVVLESDKASFEVPAPEAGTVVELLVEAGSLVSAGTPIARLETATAGAVDAEEPAAPTNPAPGPPSGSSPQAPAEATSPTAEVGGDQIDVVVLGAGPGGYAAAFRAADLGLEVVLVERYERLGGVCLNVGCIPSKALLHVAKLITDARDAAGAGVAFGAPQIDLDGVRAFKDGAVEKLTGGIVALAKGRGVRVVCGEARFTGANTIGVGEEELTFAHCIVAAGSAPIRLPDLPDDPRILDSTGALELTDVPARLLVVGGGIIGLELATVYDALGSEVTVVELADQLIPGCDPDLVKPLHKRIGRRYAAIHLGTSVEGIDAREDGVHVSFASEEHLFDRVLVAVGRAPNGGKLGLDAAGVEVDERGFVGVDDQLRTNVPHILAIGDVCRGPMLAHKATHEGHLAAEIVAGHDVAWDVRAMPSVAYTDPEIAWVGLTEGEAKADGTAVEKAVFPWAASGRALSTGRPDGSTKVLFDPETRRVLGGGIVGPGAGELIAELALAVEMAADVEDVALTVHPHPTLSETVGLAAEAGAGTITDLPKRRAR